MGEEFVAKTKSKPIYIFIIFRKTFVQIPFLVNNIYTIYLWPIWRLSERQLVEIMALCERRLQE